ncbi:H+/nucleoside cotransporter [Diplocarpon rosae]|nr:H+/nucleoside cotransporter [Diplocarpon rosae]
MLTPYFFPVFWALMTGWWIAALNLHRHDIGGPTESWLIPTLLWLALTWRLVTLYISTKYITRPVAVVWMKAIYGPAHRIPPKLRLPLAAAGTVAVFLVGSLVTEETQDNTRANRAVSLFGLAVFILGFYITSNNRKAIRWQTVIVGMLSQYILALFVLRTQAGWCIGKFAVVFFYGMKVSGAEAVAAAASPFVGQGESAMLIKPFIPHLTTAELHQILTSGFATIAGSVLGAYISMGISPLALISSCVMSIPASLAISKLRYPETEETLTAGKIVVPADTDERPSNGLHAFANGSWLGLKVGGMIIAALLCILALLGLANGLLGWWGRYLNIEDPLSVELIVGYIFYPVAFLLGVPRDRDLIRVSKLIGLKIVANEFVAIVANEFVAFAAMVDATPGNDFLNLSSRSRLIATYAVCGFGNISSVGIQIGVLSSLGGDAGRIAKIAFSALVSGVIATLTSASIAGMLIKDTAAYVAVTPAT